MKLDYDNRRTRDSAQIDVPGEIERKSPLELFAGFYELQNSAPMSEEQSALVEKLAAEIWGEEEHK